MQHLFSIICVEEMIFSFDGTNCLYDLLITLLVKGLFINDVVKPIQDHKGSCFIHKSICCVKGWRMILSYAYGLPNFLTLSSAKLLQN